jgi:hypothetical protein
LVHCLYLHILYAFQVLILIYIICVHQNFHKFAIHSHIWAPSHISCLQTFYEP